MKFKCQLPPELIENVSNTFEEFANGGAQATIRLKDGRVFYKALIADSTAIVAIRGFTEPPFDANEIYEIYQTEEDKKPQSRSEWEFWDEWQ